MQIVPRNSAPFKADAPRSRSIQLQGSTISRAAAGRPDQPTVWKALDTGSLLRFVEGQVEYGEDGVFHADQPGAKQRDAPVAWLQPALAPDPERPPGVQPDPPRERGRPLDALDGEHAVDGQEHVVVLGEGGEGAVHLVDAVLDLGVVIDVQCAPDVLVSALSPGGKAGGGHGQPALDRLTEVGDVELELTRRALARRRKRPDGPRMEGVEAHAALRRVDR